MSALSADMPARVASRGEVASPKRWALAALGLGSASAIGFAAIAVTVTTTTTTAKDLNFHHAGDYWYTAIGLPAAVAAAVLLFAMRALQPQARPRLTTAGAVLNAVALALLFVMLSVSIATGAEARWGGAYVIGTLATFVGHGLFVAGTWRTGLVPRPMLAVWPVVWLIGAFGAQGPTPLLLAAFYGAMAVLVARRA